MYEIINVGSVYGGEAFLFITEDTAALIDTGFAFSADKMVRNTAERLNGRRLDSILLTHSHYDHVSGVPYCREKWPEVKVYAAEYAKNVFERSGAVKVIKEMNDNAAEVYGCRDYRTIDKGLYADIPLKDGDTINLGSMEFKILETPGHTKDCISFWCEKEKLLFSSETPGYPLLPEKVVPVYLIGYEQTVNSIKKLMKLDIEKMLVSHLGIVDREFIGRFLPMAIEWAGKAKTMVLDGYYSGMDTQALIQLLKKEFYNGDIITLQPEKAFDLNAYYTVTTIIKECAGEKQN